MTIAALAGQLGLNEREAIAQAADCAAAGYVQLDVKGPPYAKLPESAMLTDKGWRAVCKRSRRPPGPRESS
jgi:dihydrodipicolinate synthase/N-acetylneuraminate lyase